MIVRNLQYATALFLILLPGCGNDKQANGGNPESTPAKQTAVTQQQPAESFAVSSSADRDRSMSKYHCTLELLASPYNFNIGDTMCHYRAYVVVSEIYQSLHIDCVKFWSEGSETEIKYDVALKSEQFEGSQKPRAEGVSVHVVRWMSMNEVLCKVGDDEYKITCDPNPTRIQVVLQK